MRSIIVFSFLIIVLISLSGCDSKNYTSELVKQYNSPDQGKIISVIKFNYGATVPYVFRVFAHSKGVSPKDIEHDYDILRIDSYDGLIINWGDNNTIEIKCIKGSVYKYTSIGQVNDQRLRINLNTGC